MNSDAGDSHRESEMSGRVHEMKSYFSQFGRWIGLKAVSGATIRSMVYVIQGVKESLMGCMDALRLGLLVIRKEGVQEE